MPLTTLYNITSKLRNRHFLLSDIILLTFSPYISLVLRFDWQTDNVRIDTQLLIATILLLAMKLIVFKVLGLYKRFWKSASIDDLALLVLIGVYSGLGEIFLIGVLKAADILDFNRYPFSFPFINAVISFIFISVPRFSVRLFERAEQRLSHNSKNEIKVMIVGAGNAGVNTLIELQRSRDLNLKPVCLIDDDPEKKGLRIRGVDVIGGREKILYAVERYNVQRILIAMPSAGGKKLREILNIAKSTEAEVFTLPGLSEIIDGKVSIQKFRKIEIEDLLRRDTIKTDLDNIYDLLKGKVVLVTGAGGSIGREICRQVASALPAKLILLGHGENSIFEIEQELVTRFAGMRDRFVALIADLRDQKRIDQLLSQYKPQIVFHAAAHKHVPLMENNVEEAVTNNILGIKNLLESACKNNVESLIYISTDKAVDPPNVMGASKRVAEMLIQKYNGKCRSKLITVRFGNVLGSRGSVVHTFRRQIQEGGPVTITHPEIERFFMTIPEAVQLVLQAFSLGKGGEVFVLDMGKRIKIADLAKDMIRLSGSDENEIEIKYTGLRKGEKMIEELFIASENVINTGHEKIYSANSNYEGLEAYSDKIDKLIELALDGKSEECRAMLFEAANFDNNGKT